ncbi:uncharacterized protein LOC121389626 [Gigantopelta aegis]|uniref:uncharacterized protein LOC121389626 n=1 Tax=Gigantopelta aegis TaxID=1735272 RepID=UPI001B887A32|nr:uncharacterized protein LOC121389626 [Gigantopelta aegis]
MTGRAAVVVAVVAVVVLAIVVCGVQGKKHKSTTLYLEPVSTRRRTKFTSFVEELLTHRGPLRCSWQAVNLLGRRKRMCSNASLILLRAYCQWLVDTGVHPLDDFCYKAPLSFP